LPLMALCVVEVSKVATHGTV